MASSSALILLKNGFQQRQKRHNIHTMDTHTFYTLTNQIVRVINELDSIKVTHGKQLENKVFDTDNQTAINIFNVNLRWQYKHIFNDTNLLLDMFYTSSGKRDQYTLTSLVGEKIGQVTVKHFDFILARFLYKSQTVRDHILFTVPDENQFYKDNSYHRVYVDVRLLPDSLCSFDELYPLFQCLVAVHRQVQKHLYEMSFLYLADRLLDLDNPTLAGMYVNHLICSTPEYQAHAATFSRLFSEYSHLCGLPLIVPAFREVRLDLNLLDQFISNITHVYNRLQLLLQVGKHPYTQDLKVLWIMLYKDLVSKSEQEYFNETYQFESRQLLRIVREQNSSQLAELEKEVKQWLSQNYY